VPGKVSTAVGNGTVPIGRWRARATAML